MACDLNLANSCNYERIYRDFTVNDGIKHKTLLFDSIEQILAKANNCARKILGEEPKPILPKIKKQEIPGECQRASPDKASPKVKVNASYNVWGWGTSDRGSLLLSAVGTAIAAAANLGKNFADLYNIDDETNQIHSIAKKYNLYRRPGPNVEIICNIFRKYEDLLSKQ